MGFFRSRNFAIAAAYASLMTYSVSDSIVAFTPAPTPSSRSSLSHAHRFMVFFHNRNFVLAADSASLMTSSVSEARLIYLSVFDSST
jgi:hypothetical protein